MFHERIACVPSIRSRRFPRCTNRMQRYRSLEYFEEDARFFLFFFSKTSSKIPLLLRFSLPIFNRSRETHPSAMIRVYFPFHVYSARSKEEFLLSCTILRFYFPIHVYIYMFRWGCVTTDVIKVKSDLLYFIRGTHIYVSLPLRLFYANLYPMYIEYARLISVSFVRGKIKFIFSFFREMTNDTRRV